MSAQQKLEWEGMLRKVHQALDKFGYRPTQESDIQAGAELLLIEAEKYYRAGREYGFENPRWAVGCTPIRLDDPPMEETVFSGKIFLVKYHFTVSPYQAFSELKEDFLCSGFAASLRAEANDFRYYIKK